MALSDFWFLVLAVLFGGFFVLEGFDFGVGMLMEFFGRAADGDEGDAEQYRRAALNTIGPVWDGNETWLVLGGGGLQVEADLHRGVGCRGGGGRQQPGGEGHDEHPCGSCEPVRGLG